MPKRKWRWRLQLFKNDIAVTEQEPVIMNCRPAMPWFEGDPYRWDHDITLTVYRKVPYVPDEFDGCVPHLKLADALGHSVTDYDLIGARVMRFDILEHYLEDEGEEAGKTFYDIVLSYKDTKCVHNEVIGCFSRFSIPLMMKAVAAEATTMTISGPLPNAISSEKESNMTPGLNLDSPF